MNYYMSGWGMLGIVAGMVIYRMARAWLRRHSDR